MQALYNGTASDAGTKLYIDKDYKEAIKFARIALDLTEKQVGPNHQEVADILNDLGVLYESLGRNVEAEPLFKRSRLINELNIGSSEPDSTYNPKHEDLGSWFSGAPSWVSRS